MHWDEANFQNSLRMAVFSFAMPSLQKTYLRYPLPEKQTSVSRTFSKTLLLYGYSCFSMWHENSRESTERDRKCDISCSFEIDCFAIALGS